MHCQYCNNSIISGEIYCRKCGRSFEADRPFAVNSPLQLRAYLTSWFIGGYQLWRQHPLHFLLFGIFFTVILYIPGLNTIALLVSGLLIAVFLLSTDILRSGRSPRLTLVWQKHEHNWLNLLLIQLVGVLFIFLAYSLSPLLAFFALPFVFFPIPLALNEANTITALLHRSVILTLRYFIPLVVLALIFVVYAKIVISSGILLVTMVFTLPFALLVIQASFADIIVRQNEASDSAVIARLLSRLRPG
jgi:hypothetical protein